MPHQEIVVTLSSRGYIKRMPLDTYRLQRRGGRGITGMTTREADAVHRLLVADTHDSLLFFTGRGCVFQLRAYDLPDAKRQAKGEALVNLIEMPQGDTVTALVGVRSFEKDYLIQATRRGEVKKTSLSEFESVRRAGLICMDLEPGDELVTAKQVAEDDDVVIISNHGKAVRFSVKELRAASRASGGVRGIQLGKDENVVGMEVVTPKMQLLTVTANGFGKRTPFEDYPRHHRGGGGVITHQITDKTGPVVAARTVNEMQELMIISASGIILRTRIDSISPVGRSTQGVHLMGVAPGRFRRLDFRLRCRAGAEQDAAERRQEDAGPRRRRRGRAEGKPREGRRRGPGEGKKPANPSDKAPPLRRPSGRRPASRQPSCPSACNSSPARLF